MKVHGKSALGLDPNIAAGWAYVWPCAIGLFMSVIILVTDKSNKLARFHAFQSLLLFAVAFVVYIVFSIVGFAVSGINVEAVSTLVQGLYVVYVILVLAAVIFCCIKAFLGQIFKLPVIGNMADNWSN